MEEGSTIGNFENDDVKNLYFGAHGLYRNAKQVDLYLKAYNAVSDDLSSDSEKVIQLQNMLMEVDKLWEMISSGTLQPTNLTTSLHIVENLTYDFLQLARSMCSSVWAQFDLSSMLVGLAIFSLALIVIVFEITSSLQTNWTGISMFGGFTIIGTTILVHLYYPLITSIRGYECSILIIIVIMSALYFILTLQNHQYKKCIAMKYMLDCEHLPVIVVALMFAVFFSNSYVVCEDSVVSFLTISLLGYKALFSNLDRKQGKRIERKSKQKSLPFPWYRFRSIVLAVVSGVCIRAFTMFKKCREEQWWCAPTDVFRSLSDISTSSSNYTSFKSWRFFISIICVWALILSFQWLLRRAGNLNGFLPAVMCATYAPAIMGICICFYWALQCLPSTLFGHILQQYEVVLPNVVFIVAALCIIVLLLRPLCIYTVFQNNDNIGPILSGDKGEIFHLVYRYIKGNWRKHLSLQHGESKKNTVIVYGLASVFSASVFAAIIIVTPTLILLTNDGLALAFLILVVAAASGLQCLVQSKYSGRQYDGNYGLIIFKTVRFCSCTESCFFFPESISIPWSWVLLWSLLSSIGFYGTGHQYTFTSLHWNAALVGSDGQFTNYVLPAIKVLLNTFSSTLLFAMSLPLLLLWPFTSRLIFDNEVHHMSETSDDIKKGEFVLHGEPRFFRALFDLSTKYLAVQGIKVI